MPKVGGWGWPGSAISARRMNCHHAKTNAKLETSQQGQVEGVLCIVNTSNILVDCYIESCSKGLITVRLVAPVHRQAEEQKLSVRMSSALAFPFMLASQFSVICWFHLASAIRLSHSGWWIFWLFILPQQSSLEFNLGPSPHAHNCGSKSTEVVESDGNGVVVRRIRQVSVKHNHSLSSFWVDPAKG